MRLFKYNPSRSINSFAGILRALFCILCIAISSCTPAVKSAPIIQAQTSQPEESIAAASPTPLPARPIYAPGELEWLTRRERLESGVPIAAAVCAQ